MSVALHCLIWRCPETARRLAASEFCLSTLNFFLQTRDRTDFGCGDIFGPRTVTVWGCWLNNPAKMTGPMTAPWSLAFQTLHPGGCTHPRNTAGSPEAMAWKQAENEGHAVRRCPRRPHPSPCHGFKSATCGHHNTRQNEVTPRPQCRLRGFLSQGGSFALLVLSFLSRVHSHPPLVHTGSEVPWWLVRWEAAYRAQA